MEQFLQETNQKIVNALEHLRKELSGIRAGRANPALLEEIPVSAYGSQMKIMELGTISAPQPTLLTVLVWDNSVVDDVRKAILNANLGLNPSIDGQTLRIAIPPLNEERRTEFVKLAHQKGEGARIEMRQIRQEAREEWEKAKESGDIGEDELHRRIEMLQRLIDQTNGNIDELVKDKEAELMTV